jgi:hypothetical protein
MVIGKYGQNDLGCRFSPLKKHRNPKRTGKKAKKVIILYILNEVLSI